MGLGRLGPGLGWINGWRPDSDRGLREQTDGWDEFGGVARVPEGLACPGRGVPPRPEGRGAASAGPSERGEQAREERHRLGGRVGRGAQPVHQRTAEALPIDPYADSRRTGSFLLIDPADGTTLTAGMAGNAFAEPLTRPHS
ncbi:hypothetical protein [Streptomyces armeniacus]|uniref:hypothetical protein n=1 Tax=Streptomyces armeniacus TaxID=83291 RepID=UPI00248307C0|nr:hypothetical protein [Streptomyces armeniacus]